MNFLVCYGSSGERIVDFPADDLTESLQPIYDLLKNGRNVALTLVKNDGARFTYQVEGVEVH